jgi:hypothetical protein
MIATAISAITRPERRRAWFAPESPAAFLQCDIHAGVKGSERGSDAAEDAGHDRERKGKGRNGPVDADI